MIESFVSQSQALEFDSEIHLNLETADRELLNKFVLYTFSQYDALNFEDFNLWDAIQVDYEN